MIRKTTPLVTVLAVAMALTGCFREDFSFCPFPDRNNVVIGFCLPDSKGECSFLDNVSAVNTVVYDADGNHVLTKRTETADHQAFKGVRMRLDPGTYRVVCWGNVNDNTVMSGIEGCYNGGGSHITYKYGGSSAANGDRVFYAPREGRMTRSGEQAAAEYTMVVDEKTGHSGNVDFTYAHRTLEVYVKGYKANGGRPDIEVTELPEGLEFLGMKCLCDGDGKMKTVSVRRGTEIVTKKENGADVELAKVVFDVFTFDTDDNNIMVNVLTPGTDETLFGEALTDVIKKDTANDPDRVVIEILFTFKGASVEVGIPSWGGGDIGTGFN